MKLLDKLDDLLSEPTLEHLDAKIFTWLLSTVLAGLVLGSMLTGVDDSDKIRREHRPVRSSIRITRTNPGRAVRKKAA